MAVDSRQKRMSIMNWGNVWRSQWPIGDGAFDQGDRQHLLRMYSGILWAEADISAVYRVIASQLHAPGAVVSQLHTPGAVAKQVG
jgi:hypothetical protein